MKPMPNEVQQSFPKRWDNRFSTSLRNTCSLLLTGMMFMFSFAANCQEPGKGIISQEVFVESSRLAADGEKITASVISESTTEAPKAVLLVLPSLTSEGKKSAVLKINRYEPTHYPLSRNRESLLQSGFALAWMGWPTHVQLGIDGTASYEVQESIASVIKHVRQRWPDTPLVLTGTYSGAHTALAFAIKHRDSIDRLLALSPQWLRERNEEVESLGSLKTLVVYDASGECLNASTIEVEEISKRAGFKRVPVYRDSIGRIGNCNKKSAIWLAQADADITSLIGKWIDGQPLPDYLGADMPTMTTNERVIFVKGKSGQMEVTLYTPSGKGPFPLLLFNHGDIEGDSPYIRYKQRFRESIVSTSFLRLGFAAAVPARPGVARSEGRYSLSFARNDGDATYKARVHSEAIVAALDGLKGESDFDLSRIILSGQSAGGDAVMYMNTLAIPGVRGVVNFSGGRNNNSMNGSPTYENRMMIDGWAEMGKVAKAPVILVFAENDSRYSPNTVRKSTLAFIEAGGKAELLLLPPQARDGHYVYHSPKKWTSGVMSFVDGLAMGNTPFKYKASEEQSDVE